MKQFTCLFLLPLLLAASLCLAHDAAPRPNVIVVMTDDQGYGELSCHGNPILSTPNLDRLYSQSVRLTDFHVAPMCTPTRGQLLSGLDAVRNGAMNVSSGRTLLRAGLPTLGDVFQSAGYRTGIFGKWHVGDNYPYRPQDRGFDESIWFPSSHINSLPDFWNNDYFDDTYWHNGRREKFAGYCTDVFFSEAMEWFKRRAAEGAPFLAYIPTNAPHGPHFVPDRYRAPIAAKLEQTLPQLPRLNPPQQRALVSFLAMIANIDENIGRLDAALRESGLADNTILIFLTDNGSTMGPRYFNAGMKGGKTTLWEGGHRVPCFIRWPQGNLRSPGDVAELCQVQDLLPTLIDLCGLETPPGSRFDGLSLAPLLRGKTETLPDRMLVVNYSRMPIGLTEPSPDSPAVARREGAAVLWRRWRLLEDKQLYNLDSDPLQQTNVIDEHPEVAAKMRAHLDRWWQGVEADANRPQRVVIGSPAESEPMLSACEWFDVFVDQQRQVRRADRKNGVWHLQVAADGRYRLELRRWPREADLPLRAAPAATQVTDGIYVEGVTLPIAHARIRVGNEQHDQAIAENAKSAAFEIDLKAGPTTLQTWFDDEARNALCGAYYVYVRKL
jgi:arylsulfatase A-like enzyme